MKNEKHVAIIILNWNGIEDTVKCLTSVEKLVSRDIKYKIYVVDNGSTDNSVERLKKEFKSINLIVNSTNLGYASGNNVGIKRAILDGAEYIWLLNNDTVVEKYAMVELVDVFDDPTIGIATSKIYFMRNHEFHYKRYKDNERGKVIWYAGGLIDWNNVYGSHRGVDEVDHGQFEDVGETDFATGCSLMITRKCLETIGFFDERYFAYIEDMDLSIRVHKYGWKIVFVPTSILWHKNAGSTDRPGNDFHQYYMTRNRLLFGLSYASNRTKIALLRESLRILISGSTPQKHAIRDTFFARFGKQFIWNK